MAPPVRSQGPGDVVLRRLLAFALDSVVMVALIALVVLPVDVALPSLGVSASSVLSSVILGGISAAIMWGYFTVPEALFGSTVGKLALGVRVVCEDTGEKPGFRQASVRNAWRFLEILPLGVPALIAAMRSPVRQRVGDRRAHTLVIGR